MTSQTSLTRNNYGELLPNSTTTTEHRALIAGAWQVIKKAATAKRISAAYDNLERDRKGRWSGSACHHEIYDTTPTGSKVLLCVRETEGSKYGVATISKTYYLLTRHGKGVKVAEANKAVAAKAAKAAGNVIGYAIEVIEGKSRLKMKSPEKRQGYKALTLDADGAPISVWDDSPWTLGKTRTEKATDDHTGGFYYYRTLDEVLASAHSGEIFGTCREHHNLVIARVEAWGNEIVHYGGKRCVTHIKPLEIIASVTV